MKEFTVTDVRVIRGDTAFLLDNGKTAILFDTGFGFTGYQVAEKVQKILGDRRLDYIFLSHSHYDHALGSAYVLRTYPDAKVVAGEYVAEIFKREGAKRVMKDLDARFAATCGVYEYEFLGDELRVDITCKDKDKLIIDDMTFEVLNLPGHTKCSVGFYCEEQKLLLSSESLGVYDGIETIIPSCLVGYQMALDSISRAGQLKIRNILSPHYGLLDEKQTAYFLSHMQEATKKLAMEFTEQIRAGLSDEEMIRKYRERYWHGFVRENYPIDAMNLNTSIMINLIRKEFKL